MGCKNGSDFIVRLFHFLCATTTPWMTATLIIKLVNENCRHAYAYIHTCTYLICMTCWKFSKNYGQALFSFFFILLLLLYTWNNVTNVMRDAWNTAIFVAVFAVTAWLHAKESHTREHNKYTRVHKHTHSYKYKNIETKLNKSTPWSFSVCLFVLATSLVVNFHTILATRDRIQLG